MITNLSQETAASIFWVEVTYNLKKEAGSSLETLVAIYQTARPQHLDVRTVGAVPQVAEAPLLAFFPRKFAEILGIRGLSKPGQTS
jgi:hypothetical protein